MLARLFGQAGFRRRRSAPSVRGLVEDRRANVSITFAILLLPLFGMAGGAIDYGRVTAARSHLQDAADSAALAAARILETSKGTGDPVAVAKDFFKANFKAPDATLVSLSVTSDNVKVTVDATADVSMVFLGILGMDTMSVGVHAETLVSTVTLEIVLTLDNTGSMEGTRMATLKDASKVFVDQLTTTISDANRLKFGVVPFSAFVNVGSKYRTASWIDQDAKSPRANSNFNAALNRFELYDKFSVAWPGCVEMRPSPHDVTDTPPDSSNPSKVDTLFVPAFWPDEPDWSAGYWYPNDYIPDKSKGDEIARMTNAAKYNAATSIDRSDSLFFSNYKRPKGPDFGCDITAVLPLTNDYTAVRTALAGMKAFGSTNIPEGVAWGWRVLSPDVPFTEGRAYGTKDNQKIMVLMTDGANSLSTYGVSTGGQYSAIDYPYHDYTGPKKGSNMRPNLDAKTQEVCDNAKAKGIEIYAIGLELGSDTAAKDLLAKCATSSSHFYDAKTTAELVPIFDRIAQRIGRLRLAR